MIQPTVKVFFSWESVQPDRRQWKPSNPVFKPINVVVGINVPLDHEHIYNSEEIIQSQINTVVASAEVYPIEIFPILTTKGMRFCIDQFENQMNDTKEENTTIDDEEEWEEAKTDLTTQENNDEEEWE